MTGDDEVLQRGAAVDHLSTSRPIIGSRAAISSIEASVSMILQPRQREFRRVSPRERSAARSPGGPDVGVRAHHDPATSDG